MNFRLLLVAAIATLTLGACHNKTRVERWQEAKAAAPLEIPQDLDRPGRSAELAVPGGDIEGSVTAANALPPTSINIDVKQGIAETWRRIGEILDASASDRILSRDAARASYGLSFRHEDLAWPKRGFFRSIFQPRVDRSQVYYAAVRVVDENGQVMAQIDGDGPAVRRVDELLAGKLD